MPGQQTRPYQSEAARLTALAAADTTEATTRAAADTTEATTRGAADTALTTRINNEGINAFGLFIAATGVIQTSNGLASVVRSGIGNYLITLSVAMASVSYVVLSNADGGGGNMFTQFNIISTTQFRIFARVTTSGALTDPDYISFIALQ